MREFTRQLLDGGEAALKNLIGQPESFVLEFKTKEQSSTYELSKGDKKSLGKTLSGFSNADGGVVIFGIKTERRDHQDFAIQLCPISDIERFKSDVDGRLGELIRFANPSIASHTIPCADDPNCGYLLIDIGESELRPHMSMAPDHQKYFRRSVDGTRVMDHSLIRDLMMAPREARIKPRWQVRHRSTSGHKGKRIVGAELMLYMENVGFAMAAMPYVRIWTTPTLVPRQVDAAVAMSSRTDGSVAYYGTRDAVIHPSDEIIFGCCAITMTVEDTPLREAIKSGDWASAFQREFWGLGSNYVRETSSLYQEFETLEITVSFGAQNAQKKEEIFQFNKFDLIKITLPLVVGDSEALAQAQLAIEVYIGQKVEKPTARSV